jgi:hypothetical protein
MDGKRFITSGPGSRLLRSYLSYDENEVLCCSRIQNLQLKKIKIISFFLSRCLNRSPPASVPYKQSHEYCTNSPTPSPSRAFDAKFPPRPAVRESGAFFRRFVSLLLQRSLFFSSAKQWGRSFGIVSFFHENL